MFSDVPKFHHAIIAALIGIGFMLLSTKAQGRAVNALYIAALVFALLTVLVTWRLIMQSLDNQTSVQTDWMIAYGKLDEEGRAVMGMAFPAMRYRIKRGVARPYFEDTFVLVETFQTFLKDSDRKHISPERNWNSADMPRKMWKEIFDYLEAEGKIVPDSAAGSHSWEWVGNWYERYCAAYWTIGRTFVDMNLDMEQENRSTS